MAKTSKAELYKNIARAIDRDPMNLLPEFPCRLYVTESRDGGRMYLKDMGDGVVQYVQETSVAGTILKWINDKVVATFGDYQLDHKNAVEATRVWRSMTVPVRDIMAVAWKSDEGLTFRRLPWDPAPGPHPLFDEMMSRISNSRALMCFIGSLLEGRSDMQQYVWLHGQGQNGKGALSRFLHDVLGQAYSSQNPPTPGNNFWTAGLLGCRLAVYPDCNNQSFVTSGLFKSLTGGDPVRIEQKMQPSTTAVMIAKHLFMSNGRPDISSEMADQRRCIYCEMKPIVGRPRAAYQAELWQEGGAFLYTCLELYRTLCPEFDPIPVDNSQLGDITSENEEHLETAWEQNFEIRPEQEFIMPTAFQDRLNEIWPRDRKRQKEFRDWVERKFGIRKRTNHGTPGDPKVYFGMGMIYQGHLIRTSQEEQKKLQEKWDGKRMSRGPKPVRLEVLDGEGGD